MPFQAPGKVTARPKRMNITTYGKMARKYEALPELRMPKIMPHNFISIEVRRGGRLKEFTFYEDKSYYNPGQ